MLPHALSSEACSLAPGVERFAVTAEIELGPDGTPRSAGFYRSLHSLQRPARLRPARRDLRRAGAGAGGRRRAAGRGARRRRGPGRAARNHQPRHRVLRARVPLRLRRQRDRRPGGRPDRGAPVDRAADDPRQRAGRPAAGAQARGRDLPRPRPAGPAADRAADRPARTPSGCRPRRCGQGISPARRGRSPPRRVAW